MIVHGDAFSRWELASFFGYLAWLWLETLAWVTGPWPLFASFDGLVHFVIAANLFVTLLRHAWRRTDSPGLRALRLAR